MKEYKNNLNNNNDSTSQDVVTPTNAYWFPMRVTYGRSMQVKSFLDSKNIENFLPIKVIKIYDGEKIGIKEEPAINNLIFIHSSMQEITVLKHGYNETEPLRYMTYRPVNDPNINKVITVPERQMVNFINACKGPSEDITYLNPDELLGKAHQKVEIISGPFKGVRGVIKRIHGNRRFVVELEGLCGVQLKMISKGMMKIL